jgi:hypothetical protein
LIQRGALRHRRGHRVFRKCAADKFERTIVALLFGLVFPVGTTLGASNTLYVSDQTYTVPQHGDACGTGTPTYCTIYAFAFGSTTPVTISKMAFGGHIAWLPTVTGSFTGGIFADDSTGTSVAFYPSGAPLPIVPSAFTGGLDPGTGSALAVDQLGNIFLAAPFNDAVYGFHYNTFAFQGFQQNVTPFEQLTSGVTLPNALAIVP